MKAILLEATGGAEKLKIAERTIPRPDVGQVLVKVVAAGVNYMDVGVRTGMYAIAPLPMTPGVEGAGIVEDIGQDVEDLRVGDRVAWFFAVGSYAEKIVAPAAVLVRIPDALDFETAAGLLMQGLTASHFVTETYAVKPGDIALVHSAAGGVGLMLVQMLKHIGARVIGRVSTPDKARIAREAGADEVIITTADDFAPQVLALTGGQGVHVVYDGAGADTFYGSLASLRRHGVLAYYGQTIKRQPPIDLLDLPHSVLVTYPVVQDHVPDRASLLKRSQYLFDLVLKGALPVKIGGRYSLAEAEQAHRDLEARRTVGKILLIP